MTDLDPDIARFNAEVSAAWRAHPPLESLTMAAARIVAEQVRAPWAAGGPIMADTRELTVETGAGPLRLRVHRPRGAPAENAPALLYLHGGGFVLFSLDTHDRLMREYADQGGFVVVGVDYPLSPEHPYPEALDRLVALIRGLGEAGRSLGLNPGRITIGGDSAGANLALSACMRLRDEGAPVPIRGILANYGAFSPAVSDEAEALYGGRDAILTRSDMAEFFAHYLGSAGQVDDPYAVPLAAPDVSALPPMFLVIPECDVLKEQSLALESRILDVGGDIFSQVYEGATHSFLEAMSISALARRAIADGAQWLRSKLA